VKVSARAFLVFSEMPVRASTGLMGHSFPSAILKSSVLNALYLMKMGRYKTNGEIN
jgi:hypothetical protein